MVEMLNPANWTIDWHALVVSAIILSGAALIAFVAYRLAYSLLSRVAKLSETDVDEMVIERIRSPIKWSFVAIGITMAAQVDPLLQSLWEPLAKFLRPALLGWIAFSLVKAFTAAMEVRLDASADPVAVRSRRTRISVLSRTAMFAIIFITVGLMLLGIPGVRDIGTTLLASAGLAALAVGAAAQPALKSLIAGLQIALTEPMRIGDLVVVDGHTGRVEEIRMSFVTLRIWDERLVIVPTERFLNDSFENWSRRNERLSGPVFLHLDPATEIAPIRDEFLRYVSEHELSDQRSATAMVTEAYPESVELRLAMSAKTIADLFSLRCDVREHMLDWIRENQESALIRHRLEVPGGHPKAGEPDAP